MEESAASKKAIPNASDKEEDLFDPERFKQRMSRWMESVDELWDEYEKLKEHSLSQKE